MNFLYVLKFILFLTKIAQSISADTDSIFQRTFKILHEEPPPLKKIIARNLIINSVIEQKIDNFDENNNATWLMRYKENPIHFKPGGPTFIFLGGEWAISDGSISGGHFYDMAAENNAYLFYTEHRYYGKSYPTEDLTTDNLKYLSVKQSLADLAHFIKDQKKKTQFKDSKVIIAGGSYSATMVAWFRQKYPELTVGGWSSSAPLHAKVDFKEYLEVTGQSIKLVGGENCYNRIQNGVNEMEAMVYSGKFDKLKLLLNVCDNFDAENKYDIMTFFGVISNIAAALVQQNHKEIKNECELILKEENDFDGVINWLRSYTGSNCEDFTYKSNIEEYKYNTINSSKIYRQWIYQTCNEFGWYQTTGSEDQPFGKEAPIELQEKWCEDLFGISKEKLYENIEKTNEFYGGWKPNVTNVFFTHGALDPWSAMGLHLNDDGENNMIPFYSHCNDLASISDKDTQKMRASKEKLSKLIKKWLN